MKKNIQIILTLLFAFSIQNSKAQTEVSLGELLRQSVTDNAKGYLVAAKLIEATGLQPELSKIQDETYEELYKNGRIVDNYSSPSLGRLTPPEHRKYGYTVFAEPDEYWETVLNKNYKDISVADVKNYLVSHNAYPNAKKDDNYSDEGNIVYEFVSYHILPLRLTPDKLVTHHNEKGYYYMPSSNPHSIPVWELYTTLGQRRLLKVYDGDRHAPAGIFLNRFPKLDNGMRGTYREQSCLPSKAGIAVDTTSVVRTTNGMIYSIGGLLLYNQATAENLQSQRLRFDLATIFPELTNNNIRMVNFSDGYILLPANSSYKYVDALDVADGTCFSYLDGQRYSWQNLNGDEFNVTGNYDFTLQIPPVPVSGEYELRLAVQNNSSNRSMAMMYWGDDKDNLKPIGTPVDMRIGGSSQTVGWQQPVGNDKIDRINDIQMYHKGFMKGPEAYHAGNLSSATARNTRTTTRRILLREHMDAGKTYYLRVKNVLNSTTKEFYLDYIELCSDKVYANPNEPEDIW